MKPVNAVKATISEKLTLGLILALAALLRLWGSPAYFPRFWDEAKYLCEVEGILRQFSVNVGSFAFLKLGYLVVGPPAYPQIVAGVFGIFAVAGCYFCGTRIFPGQRPGIHLGLLMAGLAALMPYFVRYSQHAFPAVFALCFFIWAMGLYLAKLNYPQKITAKNRKQYQRISLIAAALLAMIPACSFKFLFPTFALFIVWEIYIWRVRQRGQRKKLAAGNLAFSLIAGSVMFVILPFFLAVISGYEGWFDRARTLSESHAAIGTLRLVIHFLYPIHLYYFCGLLFAACALAGIWVILVEPKKSRALRIPVAATMVILFPFLIYLLFFGFLSHLQAARLYVLTIPFLIFTAAVFLLWLKSLHPKIGVIIMGVASLLVLVSLGNICRDQVSKEIKLNQACDVIMQKIRPDQDIFTSSMLQVYYGTKRSPYYQSAGYHIESPAKLGKIKHDQDNPPLVVINDGADLVFWLADRDKYDRASGMSEVRAMLARFREFASTGELIFAAEEQFTTSPYYYLENVYSWQSYHDMSESMTTSRDSLFVYHLYPDSAESGM